MATGELKHIVVRRGLKNRIVQRTGFVKEANLQSLIQGSPELLGPLGAELNFLPIGFEVQLESRRLDLLFLDSEGVLTLIETKLRANDESRREVIGQVLEYALSVENWDADRVRSEFSTLLTRTEAPEDLKGLSFEDAASLRFGWSADEPDEKHAKLDALTSKLAANLERGFLRVVIGVDERIEGLERLVQYFSKHSDLQVVLLQVNLFPVEDELNVLIPTLHGDIEEPAGRRPSTQPQRLSLTTLLESFPEADKETIRALIEYAQRLGASFEPGPSGTSVRFKTQLWPQPVTVAWFFAPGKQGWMRTGDLSFGHQFVDNKTIPAAMSTSLEKYAAGIRGLGVGTDASSKGIQAWRMTAGQAGPSINQLCSLLKEVSLGLAGH